MEKNDESFADGDRDPFIRRIPSWICRRVASARKEE
jgi:hypothetical protein